MSTKELIYNEVAGLSDEEAEKLYSLIHLIFKKKESSLSESQKAFQELEKLKKKFSPPVDDEKEEYIRHLEEKYDSLG